MHEVSYNRTANLITKVLDKITNVYSQDGLKGLINIVTSIIASRTFTIDDDIVLSKSLDELRNYSLSPEITISALEDCDVEAFKQFCLSNDCTLANKKILNSILRNKLPGFIARINDEIVGYLWWTNNQISPERNHPFLIRYGINLSDDEAYMFDFFIISEYRGGGNAVKFLSTVELKLRELGFQKVFGHVLAGNKPARWLYSLNGYKEVRTIRSYKILKLILVADNKIFIKNNKLYSAFSFDYRPLLPYSFVKNGSHR